MWEYRIGYEPVFQKNNPIDDLVRMEEMVNQNALSGWKLISTVAVRETIILFFGRRVKEGDNDNG